MKCVYDTIKICAAHGKRKNNQILMCKNIGNCSDVPERERKKKEFRD